MPDVSAASIWRLNHRVLTSVLNGCIADFEALGLEPKEFFVLAEVDECRYPAAVATRLATPKASVTVYLKTLEAAGLLRREIDKGDLRRHRLVLTPRGSKTLHKAQSVLADAFEGSLAALDTAERAEFQRLLEKVLDRAVNAATDGADTPAGTLPVARVLDEGVGARPYFGGGGPPPPPPPLRSRRSS